MVDRNGHEPEPRDRGRPSGGGQPGCGEAAWASPQHLREVRGGLCGELAPATVRPTLTYPHSARASSDEGQVRGRSSPQKRRDDAVIATRRIVPTWAGGAVRSIGVNGSVWLLDGVAFVEGRRILLERQGLNVGAGLHSPNASSTALLEIIVLV
ncbi:protein of unknown function [Paraburkholderia dioscoreae]|uniref:Uncharacterized protein n=1 Tax=Paraburkholderia dioscoreae TaxID=2604047 RepID=A0A5Q4YXR8_9BURK|nr:protein of unknown function [Paraburkholderia dioscoreae]